MQYCSFSNKNKTQAIDYINFKLGSVYLNNDTAFSLIPFMKAAYKDLSSKKNKSGELVMTSEKAFTFLKQFPELLSKAAGTKKYRSLLKGSFLEVADLAEELEGGNSAEVLLKTLGLDKTSQERVDEAKRRKAAQAAQKKEEQDKRKASKVNEQSAEESENRFSNDTIADPLTTTNKEIGYRTITKEDGSTSTVPGSAINNPIVVANGRFRRSLLMEGKTGKSVLPTGSNREYVSLSDSKYELRIVSGSKVSEADQVNIPEGSMYNGLVILYVDKETGTPVRINNAGEVTENGEFLAHSWFRSPSEVSKKDGPLAALHQVIINNIVENPSLEYTLNIKGGYLGFVIDYSTVKFQIKKLNLQPKDIKSVVIRDGLAKDVKSMYVDVEGYDYLALVDPNTLAYSSTTLYKATIALLKSKEFTADEKRSALYDWLLSRNPNLITIKEDRLFIAGKLNKFVDEATEAELLSQLDRINLANVINTDSLLIPKLDENGDLSVESISRIDFIYDNYGIKAPVDANRKLLSAHADIAYERNFDLIEKVDRDSLEISKQSQPKKSKKQELLEKEQELLSRLGDDNLLNKIDSLSSAATPEQIAEAEAWWATHPLSKYIPLNRMFGIVNAGAVATWGSNGITLYSGSNSTDIYHEAWHGFTQLVLTKEEKIALYKAAAKVNGNKNYIQLEEDLAEDFRQYMMTGKSKVFGRSKTVNSIYKKILQILKAIFGQRTFITEGLNKAQAIESISEIYENLANGSIMESRGPAWENSMFVDLNKGIEMPDGNTSMSSANSKYVQGAIDSILVDIMERQSDADVNSFFTEMGNLEKLYAAIKTRLELRQMILEEELLEIEDTAANTLKRAELADSIFILKNAIEAYGTVEEAKSNTRLNTIGYHMSKSDLMVAFKDVVEEEDEKFELTESSDLEEFREAYDKSGNEISQQEIMDRRIKLMLATVPERDRNGNNVLDRFGLPKLLSFGKVYNDIQTALAGIKTREDLYERLTELQSVNQAFKEKGRRYNNVYEHILSQIGAIDDVDNGKQLLSGLLWKGFNLAYIPNKQVFASKNGLGITVKVKNPEGDTSKIKKKLLADFQSENPNGVNYAKVFEKYTKQSLKNSANLYGFLYDLGIVTGYSLELDNYLKQPEVVNSFELLYDEVKNNLVPSLKGKNVLEPIRVLSSNRGKYSGQTGVINSLLNFVIGLTPGMSISRRIDADGKNVYDLGYNSTQSQIVKALNGIATVDELKNNPATAHLHPDNNPLTKHSFWFKAMFKDGVRDTTSPGRIKFEHFLGVFTPDISQKNSNMTDSTKIVADLNMLFMSGMAEQVRASDKSTSYMLNINKRIDGAITKKLGLFISPTAKSTGRATRFFKAKLQADIEVMKLFRGENSNVQNSKSSSQLAMFSAILDGDKALVTSLIQDVVEGEMTLDQWFKEDGNLENFEDAIESYFVGKTAEIFNIIKRSDLVKGLDPKAISEDKSSAKSFEEDSSLIDDIVRNFLINQWLINSEVASIFVGDLGQFKDANDFTKRFAVTSTGNLFDTGTSIQNYINSKGNLYAQQVLGLEQQDTKQYDGIGNTVIVKDIDKNASKEGSLLSPIFIKGLQDYAERYNISKEEISKLIQEYKDNYNEADAQAFITLDSYRQLAIASQEWNWDTHEPLYIKIVKAAAEGGEISYQDVIDAKQFFSVRKYQYYGPLLNAEINGKKVAATALHKYSLKPIIPTAKGQPKKAIDIIHDAMVRSKVDYIVFESGSKVNNVNEKVDTYNYSTSEVDGHVVREIKSEQELLQSFANNINQIHFDYLKDVTKVKDKYKGKATSSSQLRNLLPIGIYSEGQILPGKEEAAKNYESYLRSTEEYLEVEKEKLSKVFENKTPENVKQVAEKIRRDLEKKEASDEEIEALDELINNGGNIDALPNADKIETIITNILNKRLVKAKLVGEALVQVSSAFMERLDGPQIGYSNDLKFYEYSNGKVRAAQTKIALQGEFVKLLAMKYKGETIKTLARLNEAIKDEKWLNTGNNRRMITITGVRIPVQGHNSVEVLEVVEFMDPANGTAIVVPSELPVKSGGDFDVDKLTLFYPRIFAGIKKSDNKLEELTDKMLEAIFGETGSEKEYFVTLDKQGQAGSQNAMIESMTKIILDPSNYLNLIQPNSTATVKENSTAYNHYAKAKSDEALTGTSLDYVFNVRKLKENSVGKRALGIVAANNVIMALLSRVSSNLPAVISYKGKKGMADIPLNSLLLPLDSKGVGSNLDVAGKNVKTRITEQLINGFVDIAKGAWIFNIKADYQSTPVLLSLIALGVEYDYAVALINTPKMQEMFKVQALKKEDPLYRLTNDVEMSSPKLKAINLSKWTEANKWIQKTLRGKTTPTLEELLNDETGNVAYAMYLQALPLIEDISNVMRSVKVDTVTTSTIQEANMVRANISRLSPFGKAIAAEVFNTSVQGVYEGIKAFQATSLREWFPIRSFDFSSITEGYEKLGSVGIKYWKPADKINLFKRLSKHFTSYLHQNENTTTFKELRNGTSKILQNVDIEFTGKIAVPVLIAEGEKILINLELLEQKFKDQKSASFNSYERANGVRFQYQGNFIIHEINKALEKLKMPSATEEEIAHKALLVSNAAEVLFVKKSQYNIGRLFSKVKEVAQLNADSDLIDKMKTFSEGSLVSLGVTYTLAEPTEYKEDVRKLSELSITGKNQDELEAGIFFSMLSERVALQDNFEASESSLMPYVLDKDLAKTLSSAVNKFGNLSRLQQDAEVNKFITQFNKKNLSSHASYLLKSKESTSNIGKMIELGTATVRVEDETILENGNLNLSVVQELDDGSDFRFAVEINKGGILVDVKGIQKEYAARNYELVTGVDTGLEYGILPSPETTTLSDDQVMEEMRKCNIS